MSSSSLRGRCWFRSIFRYSHSRTARSCHMQTAGPAVSLVADKRKLSPNEEQVPPPCSSATTTATGTERRDPCTPVLVPRWAAARLQPVHHDASKLIRFAARRVRIGRMPTRKPNPWRAYYLGGKKRRELGIRVRRRPGRGPGGTCARDSRGQPQSHRRRAGVMAASAQKRKNPVSRRRCGVVEM
jgi:hypothetical protein